MNDSKQSSFPDNCVCASVCVCVCVWFLKFQPIIDHIYW
jgi:hypothetical protein